MAVASGLAGPVLAGSVFTVIFERFLLGTGRMPHPVGGAMGTALCTAVKIKGDKPASY